MTLMSAGLPQTVWTLWLQGWDAAPAVCHASRASWQRQNPDWQVTALSGRNLGDYLPEATVAAILRHRDPPEVSANLLRVELLTRYGGVWADATTICARPLSGWLPDQMGSGFFGFGFPPEVGRPLASWFLASVPDGMIIRMWRAACWAYWHGRIQRHTYHWMHELFGLLCETDAAFQQTWQTTPHISALHPLHFAPDAPALFDPPTAEMLAHLAAPHAPVWKLTHKLSSPPEANSLFAHLCSLAYSCPELQEYP